MSPATAFSTHRPLAFYLAFLSLYFLFGFLLYGGEYLPTTDSLQTPCIRSIDAIYAVSGIPVLQRPNRQGPCLESIPVLLGRARTPPPLACQSLYLWPIALTRIVFDLSILSMLSLWSRSMRKTRYINPPLLLQQATLIPCCRRAIQASGDSNLGNHNRPYSNWSNFLFFNLGLLCRSDSFCLQYFMRGRVLPIKVYVSDPLPLSFHLSRFMPADYILLAFGISYGG